MAPLLPNPNPIILGLGGTENAGEATDEVKGEARAIGLKGTKSWQLQSKCPIDGKELKGSVIKQEAKAVWLLAVELLEIAQHCSPGDRTVPCTNGVHGIRGRRFDVH
ncbi:hypothetical protein SESBI_25601 [Sesbania bispinosa]|nr:hypothetical protein SESBI_25601 [Sesbania bispinosa]